MKPCILVVSTVWHYAGTGCFKGSSYEDVSARIIEDCKKSCRAEIRCAAVFYYKEKKECALNEGKYRRLTSYYHHIEVVAKGTSWELSGGK